jgi:hypothetical protein
MRLSIIPVMNIPNNSSFLAQGKDGETALSRRSHCGLDGDQTLEVFPLDVPGSQVSPAGPTSTNLGIEPSVVISQNEPSVIFGIGFQVLVSDDDDGPVIQRLLPVGKPLRQRGLGEIVDLGWRLTYNRAVFVALRSSWR